MANVRIWGTQPIKPELNLYENQNNKVYVNANGNYHEIVLPPEYYQTDLNYFRSDLPSAINTELTNMSAPFECKLGGKHDLNDHYNVLVFEFLDAGEGNFFGGISGIGANTLFGRTQSDKNVSNSDAINKWSRKGNDQWIIENSEIKLNINDSANLVLYNPYELDSKNYTVSATFRAEEDDDVFGLVFGYQDENNYYYVGYESGNSTNNGLDWGNDKVRVYKVSEGSETLLDSDTNTSGWSQSTSYNISVTISDNNVEVILDESSILSTSDSAVTEIVGTYGLIGISQIFYANSISVTYAENQES